MHFFDMFDTFGHINYLLLPIPVILLIILALIFDFLNGLHDAANSIATVVSTRVLTPQQAVIWAAFFNFIAFLLFNLEVAGTIGRGILNPDPQYVNYTVIAGALIGACAWNILTWYWGLPTSSSHALIGGLVGAGLMHGGIDALIWGGIWKTCLFILVAPMLGLVIGLGIAVAVYWLFRHARPRSVDTIFRRGQLVSAALYSLGHGGNDAQKTMGIILLLLMIAMSSKPDLEWTDRYALDDKAIAAMSPETAKKPANIVPREVLDRLMPLRDQPITMPQKPRQNAFPDSTISSRK